MQYEYYGSCADFSRTPISEGARDTIRKANPRTPQIARNAGTYFLSSISCARSRDGLRTKKSTAHVWCVSAFRFLTFTHEPYTHRPRDRLNGGIHPHHYQMAPTVPYPQNHRASAAPSYPRVHLAEHFARSHTRPYAHNVTRDRTTRARAGPCLAQCFSQTLALNHYSITSWAPRLVSSLYTASLRAKHLRPAASGTVVAPPGSAHNMR